MAGDKPKESAVVAFVDLDGDGLNDSAADKDNDGIPDPYDNDVVAPAPDTTGLYDFFDLGAMNDEFKADIEPLIPNSQAFARARVSMICLAQSRGGFGSGENFGPGEGIGSGAVLGGVCEGGVCY
ncbi:MAG: hypothetical protein ABIJ61_11630 [bacterium]